MWLAKEVAHTVDVDGMLEQMEPRQFKEWAAMFRILNPPPESENKESSLDTMRRLAGV